MLFRNCIEPAEEGNEGGVPVDGNFVGGIGLHVVDVGLVGIVGRIGGIVHVALVLLSRVGTTHQHAREGSCDSVCLRDAMMGMQGRLVTKACHIAVASGIASQEVVGILKGITAILGGAQQMVGIEERQRLTAAMLCQTAPSEVTRTVSVGRLEARVINPLDGMLGSTYITIMASSWQA